MHKNEHTASFTGQAEEAEQGFMRRAIELSKKAMDDGAGPPFGAVIVRDGKVVAEGHNNSFLTKDPTAHAEIVAIRRACEAVDSRTLEGCVIYSSSEPCPMCLGAIYWSRIAKVYFGTSCATAALAGFSDTIFYKELSLPLEKRALPMVQQLADEAKSVFDIWEARSRVVGSRE